MRAVPAEVGSRSFVQPQRDRHPQQLVDRFSLTSRVPPRLFFIFDAFARRIKVAFCFNSPTPFHPARDHPVTGLLRPASLGRRFRPARAGTANARPPATLARLARDGGGRTRLAH